MFCCKYYFIFELLKREKEKAEKPEHKRVSVGKREKGKRESKRWNGRERKKERNCKIIHRKQRGKK